MNVLRLSKVPKGYCDNKIVFTARDRELFVRYIESIKKKWMWKRLVGDAIRKFRARKPALHLFEYPNGDSVLAGTDRDREYFKLYEM